MLKDQISETHLLCLLGPALDQPGERGDTSNKLQLVGGLNQAAWIPDTARPGQLCVCAQPPLGRISPRSLFLSQQWKGGSFEIGVWFPGATWPTTTGVVITAPNRWSSDVIQSQTDVAFWDTDMQLRHPCTGHPIFVLSSMLGAFQGVWGRAGEVRRCGRGIS